MRHTYHREGGENDIAEGVTVRESVVPTGAERLVAPHELFYSTTDKRGVITSANSVFFRLAAYAPGELIGAPHNVIRHPAMPAGVFHTMWRLLQAGKPFAGYVQNLAQDGASYWTFATVTPTAGGFLSVRAAVMAQDMWDVAAAAYAATLVTEAAAIERGASRVEIATVGAKALDAELARRGYADATEFGRAALTAEALTRAARTDTRPPPVPAHSPYTGVGDSTSVVALTLAGLIADFDDYLQFADAAAATRVANEITMAGIADAARAAASAVEALGGETSTLSMSGRAAAGLADNATAALAPVSDSLASLRVRLLDLRMAVSLAKLHNDMMGMFAFEASAGGAHPEPADGIAVLSAALAASMEAADAVHRGACADLEAVSKQIAEAAARMWTFQKMLSQWRTLVVRSDVGAQVGHELAPVDARVSRGATEMSNLSKFGLRCATLAKELARQDLRGSVARVSMAVNGGVQP